MTEARRKPKYQRHDWDREKLKTEALLNLSDKAITELSGVAREFIRAANSNPVVGMTASMVVVLLLERVKLLSPAEGNVVMVAIGAIEAGQAAGGILSEMPWNAFKPAVNDTKPSASTIVYQDSSSDSGALEGARMGVKP